MKKTIEMARDAGFFVNENEVYSPSVQYDHELTPYLVRFADLIRADEREACAKVVEDLRGHCWAYDHDQIALAIRASMTIQLAAGPQAFYGFPHGSVSTSNAGGKCVTAGETAPKEST